MKRRVNKKPLIIIFLLIVAIFGALYFFRDNLFAKKQNIVEEEVDKEVVKTVSYTFAGNVLLNSEMWYDTASSNSYDFTYMFEYLNDIMKKSDVNVYNQSSIIGGSSLGKTVNTKYNSPSEILTTMSNIGFNVVTLGSNHAFDKGKDGIINSIKSLSDSKMIYSGIKSDDSSANNIIEKNGIKTAFLSYTMSSTVKNADDYVDIYSEEKVKSDIESLKADIIIVAIDWCDYNTTAINDKEEAVVKYLSSLGVNIVVGNTGYTIQPIKMIDNTLVCYSLGNLISGHSSVDNRISALVDLKVNVKEKNGSKTIEFDDINVLFTYAYNNNKTDYKVIPFSKITKELKNYQDYYTKYSEVIKEFEDISIYPAGE